MSYKINPFKIKAAEKIIEDADIEIGDIVKIGWRTESAGGTVYESSHIGEVYELDDWIKIRGSNHNPGELRLPIVALTHAEIFLSDPDEIVQQ